MPMNFTARAVWHQVNGLDTFLHSVSVSPIHLRLRPVRPLLSRGAGIFHEYRK